MALGGLLGDLPVDLVISGGGDGDERAFQVTLPVLALVPRNFVIGGHLLDPWVDLRANDEYFGVTFQKFFDLFLADISSADEDASALVHVDEYWIIAWQCALLFLSPKRSI